jgi:hypothetical protein
MVFEHIRQVARVISGARHDLSAQNVNESHTAAKTQEIRTGRRRAA